MTSTTEAPPVPTLARAVCPVCATQHYPTVADLSDIRCDRCLRHDLTPGLAVHSCWGCDTWCQSPPDANRPYCAGCLERARAETARKAAAANAVHDMWVMHRGMATALVRNGWAVHVSDYAEEYRDAARDMLAVLGVSTGDVTSAWRVGRETLGTLASLTMWSPDAMLVFGASGVLPTAPDASDMDAPGHVTTETIRDAMGTFWQRVQEISAEQAREHAYCSDYEYGLERVHDALRTPLPAPVSRERDYTISVPVTITTSALVTVTATDEDDAFDRAQDLEVSWDDIALDRWHVDIAADWSDAEIAR